jgi:energy-coupling factor transport system permease protein
MSSFEFLRNVTIGQYLPLGSLIHRLDPRTRLVAYTFLLAALTAATHPLGLLLALAGVLVLLSLAHIPLRHALRGLLAPLPFLLILAVLQVFFNAARGPSLVVLRVGPVAITLAGLILGGMLLLRFTAIILELSLASYTLSTNELTNALTELLRPLARLGLPVHDLVMIVQITLRFLPALAQTAEQIAKAQASRGADWEGRGFNVIRRARQVMVILIPLFVTSLRQAENLALAMDARGYGASNARTLRVELHFTWRDALFLAALVIFSGLVVLY